MGKRVLIAVMVLCFCIMSCAAFAASEKGASPANRPMTPKTGEAAKTPMKPNFSMISGTITKIDNSDPANVRMEIQSDMDNKTHIVSVTPWTNITKVTDMSELKTGELIRIMARTVDGKEVAMGVMFGKIKNLPMPKPPVKGPGSASPEAQSVKR